MKYRGRHTCNQVPHLLGNATAKEKGNDCRQKQQVEEKQKQSKEMLLSFETGFKIKTEDNREDIFPSFSFPIESEEVQNGLLLNSIMKNMSPAFVSPATSESNYFSVSAFHMGSFDFGQNVQTSESELTEIISAPASVTNSPIVDLDISSLEKLEFDQSFPFDNPESFTSFLQ